MAPLNFTAACLSSWFSLFFFFVAAAPQGKLPTMHTHTLSSLAFRCVGNLILGARFATTTRIKTRSPWDAPRRPGVLAYMHANE
uniref:Putative secreted protein n=1 Tax=Anopheles darlingi TaxID=43151 RepID=A0A2M4D3G6_ANODA